MFKVGDKVVYPMHGAGSIKEITNRTIENETEGKSLFVVQEKDITTRKQDKNPWLEQLYATEFLYNDYSAIVTCDQTADDVETIIRSNRNKCNNINLSIS